MGSAEPLFLFACVGFRREQRRPLRRLRLCGRRRGARSLRLDHQRIGRAETAARLDALRGLVAAADHAVIAVMIADAREDEVAQLLAAGAAQVIRKPIAAPALAEELRTGFLSRAAEAARNPAAA